MSINLSSKLDWNDVPNASDYRVLMVLNGGGPTAPAIGEVVVAVSEAEASSFIGAATDGAFYDIYVFARSATGVESAPAELLNVQVSLAPATPTGLVIV